VLQSCRQQGMGDRESERLFLIVVHVIDAGEPEGLRTDDRGQRGRRRVVEKRFGGVAAFVAFGHATHAGYVESVDKLLCTRMHVPRPPVRGAMPRRALNTVGPPASSADRHCGKHRRTPGGLARRTAASPAQILAPGYGPVGSKLASVVARPLLSDTPPEYVGTSFVETYLYDADERHAAAAEAVGGGALFALARGKGITSRGEAFFTPTSLLGDAAHIAPPAGEGANLAILGGAELVKAITRPDTRA
jgi:hypothetical protein